MTFDSNDLTLGFARAQRDLGCLYSLGFYDDSLLEDVRRRVAIRVTRPGLRAVHADAYEFRSPSRQTESKLTAAFLAPELFQTGVARAHLFPLRPASPKAWESVLVVSFPVFRDGADDTEAVRDFGSVLRRKSSVAHRFDRRITLRPRSGGPVAERYVTFLEFLELRPGGYELTMVMNDPRKPQPHAARIDLEIPPVPKGRLALGDPILGREAGSDVVLTASGPVTRKQSRQRGIRHPAELDTVGHARSFEPLLVRQVEQVTRLMALTQACLVGSDLPGPGSLVARTLDREDQAAGVALPEVELSLEGQGKVRCQRVLDALAGGSLAPGRYVFEAAYVPAAPSPDEPEPVAADARFSVVPERGEPE